MASSPYAQGFRSLEEEIQIDSLPIEGKLPSWLEGSLIRNGPAKFEVGEESYNHWFDGLAMLHAFDIADGEVAYANRFLHSQSHDEAMESGHIARSEFATDPCWSIFGRVMSIFQSKLTDNASINVARLGDDFIAMTETEMPIRFDPQTLETLGYPDFPNEVDGDVTTAHPHVDEASGRTINYLMEFSRKTSVRIIAIDPETMHREVLGSVQSDRAAYMHSFGMSENYVIVTEWPLVLNPLELLTRDKPFIENYRWKPERGTRFRVIRKSDGEVVGDFRGPARFGFHHINAFEVGDDIVVDVSTYPDASVIDELYLENLRAPKDTQAAGNYERFRLRADTGEVDVRKLSDTRIELPRINYEYSSTRPYGVVWGVGQHERGNFVDQIVRIDPDSGDAKTWHKPGHYPGEPVFVADPNVDAEGEGVLLSVVLDAEAGSSYLLVLDAQTLEERARASVPHRIPFQFHGDFFP